MTCELQADGWRIEPPARPLVPADLAFALTTPVIASGGVSSLDDLHALKAEAHTGIEGEISGKALYDGRIAHKQALQALADRRRQGDR